MDVPGPSRRPSVRSPHISEASRESPDRPRLRRTLPSRARPLPMLVPTSSFATSDTPRPQLRRWEPKCNHSTMARLYHGAYKCEVCGRTGHFGWLYRCTMDREALLVQTKEEGHPVAFDGVGNMLVEQMSLGKYGPDVRAEKYSFLKEITRDQLYTYSPSQLVTILSQRDNVRDKITEERKNPGKPMSNHAGHKYPDDNRPWTPTAAYECQYKACQDCHPLGKDKSWLSLDAILNGDILPHAATGFGFSHQGFRPIADVEIVKRISYRPIPLPEGNSPRELTHQRSRSSAWRLMEVIDEHLETAASTESSDSSTSSFLTESDESDGMPEYRGHLPQTYPLQTLAGYQNDSYDWESSQGTPSVDGFTPTESIFEAELLIRPPWTPPPTPTVGFEAVYLDEPTLVDFGAEPPSYNGRSPSSLKTNQTLRRRVFATVPSTARNPRTHMGHVCHNNIPSLPYQSEEMCDVGLVLPFNTEVYEIACNTPLPHPNLDECLYFGRCNTIVEGVEDEDASLSGHICDITDAVALTEEAIEFGTADVVARVGK